MNSKLKSMLILTGIIVLIVWAISFLGDSPETSYVVYEEEKIEDDFSNVEELHFSHMPITYSYEEDFCIGPIIPRLEWAFDILENETDGLLSFENVNDNADINFICNPVQHVEEGFITYGQSYLENLSDSVIGKTTIEFWSVREDTRPPSCFTFPNLELHQILHSLGFENTYNNKYSLMYWKIWTECVAKDQVITLHSTGKTFKPEDKIDDEIIDCLKYIYSNGEYEKDCSGLIEYECRDGWYPARDSDYCCPKPAMIINDEGDCSYVK